MFISPKKHIGSCWNVYPPPKKKTQKKHIGRRENDSHFDFKYDFCQVGMGGQKRTPTRWSQGLVKFRMISSNIWDLCGVGLGFCSWKSSWWNFPAANRWTDCHTYIPGINLHRIHGTGIFAHIWLILMVNVAKYTIHGSKKDPKKQLQCTGPTTRNVDAKRPGTWENTW